MMHLGKAFLVVRDMLVTSIMLSRPGYEGIPVLAYPGLTPRPVRAVTAWGRWQEEVVSLAHGVFAHMVDTV